MSRITVHGKILAVLVPLLALALGAAWYARPVDVYVLGIEELTAINVRISYAEPGVGDRDARSTGFTPGDPLWETVLEEVEALRFRRPPGNLIRQYQEDAIHTEAVTTDAHVVFHLWDSGGGTLMVQVGAGKPCYTSPYTGENLPASLSGGEKASQALAERLWPLLKEER